MTGRAANAWSHGLLAPEDQALFWQSAVFAGGSSLAAAAVATEDDPFAALDGRETPVDQSRLRRADGTMDETRFTRLETIREYAADQLANLSYEATMRPVHVDHFSGVLALSRKVGQKYGSATCLYDLARSVATQGRHSAVARLFGAESALLQLIGVASPV